LLVQKFIKELKHLIGVYTDVASVVILKVAMFLGFPLIIPDLRANQISALNKTVVVIIEPRHLVLLYVAV
jgi:hypothetical protein